MINRKRFVSFVDLRVCCACVSRVLVYAGGFSGQRDSLQAGHAPSTTPLGEHFILELLHDDSFTMIFYF